MSQARRPAAIGHVPPLQDRDHRLFLQAVKEQVEALRASSGASSGPVPGLAALRSEFAASFRALSARVDALQAGGPIQGGGLSYRGTWDASSGQAPSLRPQKHDMYVVSVSGGTNLDGISTWTALDLAWFDGALWRRIDNTQYDRLGSGVAAERYADLLMYAHEGDQDPHPQYVLQDELADLTGPLFVQTQEHALSGGYPDSLFGLGVGSRLLPAGHLAAGSALRICLYGQASASSGMAEVSILVGDLAIASMTLPITPDGTHMQIEALIVCRSDEGAIACSGGIVLDLPDGTAWLPFQGSGTVNLDDALFIDARWDALDGDSAVTFLGLLERPSAFGGGAEGVAAVGGGLGIEVDSANPKRPVVSLSSAAQSLLGLAGSALQPVDVKESIESDEGKLRLVGDVETPGANKVYGTNSAGLREWKDDPAGGSGLDLSLAFMESDDFVLTPIDTTFTYRKTAQWGTGTGNGLSRPVEPERPGLIRCSTGTTAGGISGLLGLCANATTGLMAAGGIIELVSFCRIPVLSDASNTFNAYGIAILDVVTGASAPNGIAATYNRMSNGAWTLSVSAEGVNTHITSAEPVLAGVFYRLRIVADWGAGNVQMYVRPHGGAEALEAAHSGAMPLASERYGLRQSISKAAGTSARTVDFDYWQIKQWFSAPR